MKTKPTRASVSAFLDSITDDSRRRDCKALARIMTEVTGASPKMWGPSIVGFGDYHYRYESGREGDWFLAGFSPRARELTVYIMAGLDRQPALMKKLGRFKAGRSCLYIKRLDDIDVGVLTELVRESVAAVGRRVETARAARTARKGR
jgi:hypothetical protein